MTADLQKLEGILAKGLSPELSSFFQGMSEDERGRYASTAMSWYRSALNHKVPEYTTDSKFQSVYIYPFIERASAVAVLLTASSDDLAKFKWGALRHPDFPFSLLEEFKPSAMRNFGDVLLQEHPIFFSEVRMLMEKGLIQKPDSDAYIVSLMSAPRWVNIYLSRNEPFYDWLMRNKDVIDDVWRLFKIEGDSENSLASMGNHWTQAILRLSDDGYLPRSRLLRASLDALGKGFIQYRSSWFSRFHEFLKPSIEERAELIDQYANLLGSPIPSTVSFALKALYEIDKKLGLSEELLKNHLSPCFAAKSKATVLMALSLLDKAIKRNNRFAFDAAVLAADALQHESADVQVKVIEILEKYGDKDDMRLLNKIDLFWASLAPSASVKMVHWLAKKASREKDGAEKAAVYTMGSAQFPGWPLACAVPIEPIQSKEGLIERALYCLEHPDQVMEIELVLDAISRFDAKMDDRAEAWCGPLQKRAAMLNSLRSVDTPLVMPLFADFILKWLEGDPSMPLGKINNLKWFEPPALFSLMQLRMAQILQRKAINVSLPLLAMPSRSGGWIESSRLVERLSHWTAVGVEPDELELTLVLLRTPPGERDTLASDLSVPVQLRNAYRYLTGADSYRNELNDLDDMLRQACLFSLEPIDTSKTLDLGQGSFFANTTELGICLWLAIAAPILRECFFATGVRCTVPSIRYGFNAQDRGAKAYFAPLTESGALLGRKALIMLTIGLIIGEPECAGLARDAMIIAIDERRLDTRAQGRECSAFLYSEYSRPKRLVQSLGEIARVSKVHADAVRQLIEYSLPGDAKLIPSGFSNLLELLNELQIADGTKLQSEEAIQFLSALKVAGKSKGLITKILGRANG